jgi:hypothetical protein
MRKSDLRTSDRHVEPLESRRLSTLTPFGPETAAPFSGPVTDFDIAVAANGTHIVAASTTNQNGTSIVAARYTASGQQIGQALTLASGLGDIYGVSASWTPMATPSSPMAWNTQEASASTSRASQNPASSANPFSWLKIPTAPTAMT